MPIYLQIDGIQGDATHEEHRKWMDIEAIHWNVARNMNTCRCRALPAAQRGGRYGRNVRRQ